MILVVDDDYDIALLIKISLERIGLCVSYFTDPLLALKEFSSHSAEYDLVISDIRMSPMNGYEFIQQIKKIKPNIKILLMSAFEFESNPATISEDDLEEVLEKPVSLSTLNEKVLKCITK